MTTPEKNQNQTLQTVISACIFGAVGLLILSPNITPLRIANDYSVHIMLGLLGVFLVSLFTNKKRVMFAALTATAALCLWLKNASNTSLMLPVENQEVNLKVANVNLSNIDEQFEEMIDIFASEDVDVISFQELTPGWAKIIEENLSDYYKYSFTQVRIDPYGIGVYSKHPFTKSDTIMSGDVPFVSVNVRAENKEFHILSSYLTPALDKKSIEKASNQLDRLSTELEENDNINNISLGEFNMVYWTQEIRNFRSKCELQNSRRDIVKHNLRVPYDHIFYSKGLECTQFEELYSQDRKYIGILGTYQIKSQDISAITGKNHQLSYLSK